MGLITSVICVFLLIYFIYYFANYFQKINSPRSYPLIGHASIMKPDAEGFISQIMGMGYLYPDAPRMVLFWIGTMPVLMLYSAPLVEKILTSSKHLGKGFAYNLLEPWLGQGIITSNVNNWRPKRKLLTPTFHYDMLKGFVPIFNEQSRILVRKLANLPKKEPVELLSFITLCGLDIICETSMGRTINAQLDKESDYVWAVHTINDLVQKRTKNPIMWNDFIYENGKLEKKCLDILHSFTRSVISERREELEEGGWRFNGRLAFLDLMLDLARRGLLDSTDIHSQLRPVDTLMFAGHDTTSTGASWALYLLGCYPETQRKAQAEIDEVLGESDYVTVEHLPHLKYLECCLKESLRIYPSVPMIMRELNADQEIEGVIVPKGTQLVINQFLVHRDPTYWQDPEDFNPDRFLPENTVGRHAFAFIPFSAGSRNCMGQRFIFSNLNMRSKVEIILRPTDGIHVVLERRRPVL
uniref:Cytochrome P450 n=1 Tax=Angiostrongylus cantonensis TaxID=6313 RepID=A0A0K0DNB3_ANGCA